MIKKTVSRDLLGLHKVSRVKHRASASVEASGGGYRKKSMTNNSVAADDNWTDFKLPNQLSPRDDSLNDSITSFNSATFHPLHFSNRKRTTYSEYPPDPIIEGDFETKQEESFAQQPNKTGSKCDKKHGTAQKQKGISKLDHGSNGQESGRYQAKSNGGGGALLLRE